MKINKQDINDNYMLDHIVIGEMAIDGTAKTFDDIEKRTCNFIRNVISDMIRKGDYFHVLYDYEEGKEYLVAKEGSHIEIMTETGLLYFSCNLERKDDVYENIL